MPTLWTETWTGSDGADWPGRWVSDGTTPTAPDILSNQGRQRTGTTAFGTHTRSVASGETATVDAEALVKLSFDNPKKAEFYIVTVRQSGGWSGTFPATGYFVELDVNGNQFTLRKRVSGASSILATVPKTFTSGTAVWVRLQAFGSAIKAKVWDDGSAEPAWDTEQTDTDITSAGHVGVSTLPGVAEVCTALWDDLTVSNANAPAGVATGTGSAPAAGPSVGAQAGSADGSGAAPPPVPSAGAQAASAAGSGSAVQPSVSLAGSAGVASGSGVASASAGVGGPAGAAVSTGTADAPAASVGPSPPAAAGSGVAGGPSVSSGVPAGSATGSGTAGAAGAAVSAFAGLASGTGSALAPVPSVGPSPQPAAGSGAGLQPFVRVLVVGTGWRSLAVILAEGAAWAAEDAAAPPVACPRDGEPLQSVGGVLHCRWDGYQWPRDGRYG